MLITIDEAVTMLLNDEVVAVPSETVYGLAGIGTSPVAVAKIFEVKNRPADNPLICHFHSIEQISSWVATISAPTLLLLQQFTPGPASFMLDLMPASPLKFATCGRLQVIARIPDHPVFLSILKKVNIPLAAPSANSSGGVSPTSAGMVEDDIGDKISGTVDGGSSVIGLESAIIDARSKEVIYILRPGAIGEKEIRNVLPGVDIVSEAGQEITTPGSRYKHYSPKTEVHVIEPAAHLLSYPDTAFIMTGEFMQTIARSTLHQLTLNNTYLLSLGSIDHLDEIARNLYSVLASIDHLPVRQAFLVKTDFGSSSLGKAIQNRLDKVVS